MYSPEVVSAYIGATVLFDPCHPMNINDDNIERVDGMCGTVINSEQFGDGIAFSVSFVSDTFEAVIDHADWSRFFLVRNA